MPRRRRARASRARGPTATISQRCPSTIISRLTFFTWTTTKKNQRPGGRQPDCASSRVPVDPKFVLPGGGMPDHVLRTTSRTHAFFALSVLRNALLLSDLAQCNTFPSPFASRCFELPQHICNAHCLSLPSGLTVPNTVTAAFLPSFFFLLCRNPPSGRLCETRLPSVACTQVLCNQCQSQHITLLLLTFASSLRPHD